MRTRYMQPSFVDLDTTMIYARMNQRRRAYQRERFLKNVCPWIIAGSTFGTLIYLIATKVF